MSLAHPGYETGPLANRSGSLKLAALDSQLPVTLMPLFRFLVAAAASLALLIGSHRPTGPRSCPARAGPAAAVAAGTAGRRRPRPPVASAPSPRAAACHNGMSFDRFLADLKQQAVADGVSQRALAEAAPYLVYDQSIVNRDRGQRVFGQVFTEFARNRASDGAAKNAQARIRMHAAAFDRAEKEYGVPPAVIAAFWGLESSFGAELGKLHTLPSLVSLAYDCRRSEMFQKETIAALKIIDRGDLTASRDDRLMGRRTRPDAVSADALFQLCGGL